MKHQRLFPALVAILFGAILSFAAFTTEASAQQDLNCCTYIVDLQVPANCLPVQVWTLWDSGIQFTPPLNANGISNHPAPPVGCPPASVFFGASLTGNPPWASFNNPKVYAVNGCCLAARISFTATGCVHITVRPAVAPC